MFCFVFSKNQLCQSNFYGQFNVQEVLQGYIMQVLMKGIVCHFENMLIFMHSCTELDEKINVCMFYMKL